MKIDIETCSITHNGVTICYKQKPKMWIILHMFFESDRNSFTTQEIICRLFDSSTKKASKRTQEARERNIARSISRFRKDLYGPFGANDHFFIYTKQEDRKFWTFHRGANSGSGTNWGANKVPEKKKVTRWWWTDDSGTALSCFAANHEELMGREYGDDVDLETVKNYWTKKLEFSRTEFDK